MKLGIVGSGQIVREFLTIAGSLKLPYISICGRRSSEDKIKGIVEEYHLDAYYLEYNDFLDSPIDTVYIALINSLHYTYAKKALEHGKNVIVEKPFTMSYKEACELFELAKSKNLLIFEAMTVPYLPVFKRMKKEVKKLGRIRMAVFQFSQYSSRYELFKEGTILPAFDVEKGGGALMDLNVYNISAVVELFGEPDHVQYYGVIEHGVDTNGTLIMKYPEYQVICIAAKDSSGPNQSLIQGEDGTIQIEGSMNQMCGYQYQVKNVTVSKSYDEENRHRMYYEFTEFRSIIDSKEIERCYKKMKNTLTVVKILEEGRNWQNK